jgi:hypothetical protein
MPWGVVAYYLGPVAEFSRIIENIVVPTETFGKSANQCYLIQATSGIVAAA